MEKSKRRILIVEDEQAIAQIYRFKLETSGYKVMTAFNGEDGLKAFGDFDPELILLDLRMPVMSGEEMLERLRSRDDGGNVRVIILTNISKDEAPAKLRLLDVDRYVVKAHHTPKQIVDIIAEVLN